VSESWHRVHVYNTGGSLVVRVVRCWEGGDGKTYWSLVYRRYIPRHREDLAIKAAKKLQAQYGHLHIHRSAERAMDAGRPYGPNDPAFQ
jgi:hypothetical protein